MTGNKVLCADSDYRSAVSIIISDIQRVHGASLHEIADRIDCSLGTVSNAINRKADLNATYLARLGKAYGGAFLNPYFALFGSQASPIEDKAKVDVLPLLSRASLKIAEARDPAGPGGVVEVPQERVGYINDLKALQRETACLIAEIEGAY